MNVWAAIQWVGSGLSLLAFIVANIRFAYTARLRHRAEVIRSAKSEDRIAAIAVEAQFFHVDVSKLPPAKQREIVLAQIELRARRELLFAGVALALFIVLGIIAISAIIESKSRQAMIDSQQPPYIEKVVRGKPSGMCGAEVKASAVQLFTNGWMLGRLTDNIHFAILRQDNSKLEWFENQDRLDLGDHVDCPGVQDEALLQWGFRRWYCHPDSSALRMKLGRPIGREFPIWAQFQNWSEGYLVVGLPPVNTPDNETDRLSALYVAFLDEFGHADKGSGRYTAVSWHALDCNISCSAIWYRTPMDRSLSTALKDKKCETPHTPDYYIKPHGSCNVC